MCFVTSPNVSLGRLLKVGWLGQRLNANRYYRIPLHRISTTLLSHQQCLKVPVVPYFCQQSILSNIGSFVTLSKKMGSFNVHLCEWGCCLFMRLWANCLFPRHIQSVYTSRPIFFFFLPYSVVANLHPWRMSEIFWRAKSPYSHIVNEIVGFLLSGGAAGTGWAFSLWEQSRGFSIRSFCMG